MSEKLGTKIGRFINKRRMTEEEKEIYQKSFDLNYEDAKHKHIAEMAKRDAENKAKRKFK